MKLAIYRQHFCSPTLGLSKAELVALRNGRIDDERIRREGKK